MRAIEELMREGEEARVRNLRNHATSCAVVAAMKQEFAAAGALLRAAQETHPSDIRHYARVAEALAMSHAVMDLAQKLGDAALEQTKQGD